MRIEPNSKLLFIGDSITDAGREKNSNGEGLFGAYGNGFVSLIQALLFSCYPGHRIRVVNQGNSGNTVLDLAARWQTDVLDHQPDWVAIMIGTNDVWRQFDTPLMPEKHVAPEDYEETLSRLVNLTVQEVPTVVLATPFFIEENRQDRMRRRMDEYGAMVKEIAKANHLICVDTQAAFDAYLDHYHASHLAWDRVHPTATGHMILARAWLQAVDFQW